MKRQVEPGKNEEEQEKKSGLEQELGDVDATIDEQMAIDEGR